MLIKKNGLGFNQGWKWKAAPRSLHREQPKWQTAMRWKISKIGASHKFIWGKQITAFHKKIWNKKVFPSGWLSSSLSYFFCWLCKPFLTQQMTLQKKWFNRWLYKNLFCLNEWLWKIFQCPCSRYCILHYNFDIKHVYFTWSRYIAYCIIILKSNMSNLFQRSKYLIFTLFQRSKYFTWSRSAFSPWGTATTRTVLGLEKMQFIGKYIFQIFFQCAS